MKTGFAATPGRRTFLTVAGLLVLVCATNGKEPTNAEEAIRLEKKQRSAISSQDDQAYRTLVAALPPEEQAWEKTLETNLGGDYFSRYLKRRIVPGWNPLESEWGYIRDDPALPRILIIGDSISRAYTLPLRARLLGKANVHRAPANCGPTDLGLQKLGIWLSQGSGKWDVVTFNFGIHDREKSPEHYAANLEKVVDLLEASGARLVWCRTTPFGADGDQSEAVNRVSDAVIARRGIVSADLHSAILPQREEYQNKDHFHFFPEGSRILAAKLAEVVEPLLTPPTSMKSEYETQQTR